MTRDLDAVLASIDGALADGELPDAMRWSPEPEQIDDAGDPYAEDQGLPLLLTARRGGIRYGRAPTDREWAIGGRAAGLGDTSPVQQDADRERALDRLAAGLDVPRHLLDGPSPPEHARARCLIEPVFGGHAARSELEALCRAMNATPEQRERLEAWTRDAAERLGVIVEDLLRALAPAMTDLGRQLDDVYGKLREAGIVPEEPPGDPRTRALWLRQHRGTGPDRQVQHRPRPRRIG